jgi:hypothetical protein
VSELEAPVDVVAPLVELLAPLAELGDEPKEMFTSALSLAASP